MKRCISHVLLALLASVLVSCGGGGDGGSSSPGGTPSAGNPGSNPGSDPGSNPATGPGGNPAGGGSFPSAGARVDETNPAVIMTGSWTTADTRYGWNGGSAVQSTVPGSTVSFTFNGTSVRWIGQRGPFMGIARVRVDGGEPVNVDLFARPDEARANAVTLYDLGNGQHTLTIEVTGDKNKDAAANAVVVDAFEVEPQIRSHLQENDPNVTHSAGWNHDPSGIWSGGGVFSQGHDVIGGALFTDAAGETYTLRFRGTSIAWSGYRGPDGGIARVKVDQGAFVEVDTYAKKKIFQEVVFAATGLADTTHELTIETTGRKNSASTGTRIVVDAFDVTTPGRRYEEYSKNVVFTGVWDKQNRNRVWSEGVAANSNVLGASVTFTFEGTSVTWIGCRKESCAGPSNVYLDGVFKEKVFTFEPEPIEGFQYPVKTYDGLAPGTHTLRIEPTSNGGGYALIDAFDVRP